MSESPRAEIGEAIKTAVPRLYLDGAFVGGCDFVREMHETGGLAGLIDGLVELTLS